MPASRNGDDPGMRLTGISGVLFAVLVVASGLVAHAPPADAPPEEVARAFTTEAGRQRASAFLTGLAALAALAFAAGLASLLARPRAQNGAVAGAVLASGAAAAALVLAGQAAHATLVLEDDLSASAVVGLFAAGNALVAAAWFPLALLVAAASAGALALGVVRTEVAVAGLVAGAALLAVAARAFLGVGLPPVVGVLALIAWAAAVGAALLVRGARTR